MLKKAFIMAKIFNYMLIKRTQLLLGIDRKAFGKGNEYKLVASWAKYTLKSAKIKIETVGLENVPDCNCLFVSNHQSYLDIPIVLSQIDKPIGFIAKKQLKKIPLLSFWMKKIHCVFLNRESVRDAIESINDGVKILQEHSSVVIFPEGTRSKGDKMGEFKKGSIKMALKASVPIVPLSICGSYKGYEEKGNFTPCTVRLVIGQPIYPDSLDKEVKKDLINYIKNSIEQSYELVH